MPYPAHMEESIRKLEASRGKRIKEEIPLISTVEREKIVRKYHPDYAKTGRRKLLIGPNKGEMVPEEFRFEGLAGLAVTELTGDIARQLGLRSNEKGVVIIRIEQGSPPEEAGLRRGDVIQEIDRKKIDGLDAYNKIVAKIKPNGTILLFINRGGKRFYQTVKVS